MEAKFLGSPYRRSTLPLAAVSRRRFTGLTDDRLRCAGPGPAPRGATPPSVNAVRITREEPWNKSTPCRLPSVESHASTIGGCLARALLYRQPPGDTSREPRAVLSSEVVLTLMSNRGESDFVGAHLSSAT